LTTCAHIESAEHQATEGWVKRHESQVFLTKLEAARRQIDAAIRMTLLNEDRLAVHTVAAAAYRILRDMKERRGRSELTDMWKAAIYSLAQEYLAGKPFPSCFKEAPDLKELVIAIANEVKNYEIAGPEQLNLEVTGERQHWSKFNSPANFLKHADRDSVAAMNLEEFENDRLLALASRSYAEIIGHLTPEMQVFGIYVLGLHPDIGVPGWSTEMNANFRSWSPSLRRRRCLSYLRKLKKTRNVGLSR
jgi:hypothetical protein